ncbi:hypothetical protein PIROE2DRAFT_69545 [Piromyces sp. E2]|nr:hypothetical protein PIROE2DRAFT_69545 [Piromyces sp. E2]|eukprot:OUM62063.1 hypothetical protein PIROE2DRAFT_69545 [Piromyces sp. E2]
MEPFGYGLSESVEEERTIDKIVSELHTAVKKFGIEKYYLMGQSIGGMYSLYWSNQYADEVLGIIGLDAIVPGAEEMVKDIPKKVKTESFFNHIGIERMLSLFNGQRLFNPLPTSYQYSDEEIRMFRMFTLQKGYSKSQMNEINTLMENLNTVKAMKIPEKIPVVNFISSDYLKQFSNWKQIHIEVGNESSSNEVIEITGDHTNFVFDQRETITKKIKNWAK